MIPESVPKHSGPTGRVDAWASKQFTLFLPIVMTFNGSAILRPNFSCQEAVLLGARCHVFCGDENGSGAVKNAPAGGRKSYFPADALGEIV